MTIQLRSVSAVSYLTLLTILFAPLHSAMAQQQPNDDGVETTETDERLSALEADVVNYRQTLANMQTGFNANTIEINLGLAQALVDLDRHDEAADAFEQALQVMRIQEGLYSESQLPLLEDAIRSASENRDWELVDRDFFIAMSIIERSIPTTDPAYESWVRGFTSWKIYAYRHDLDTGEDGNSLADALDYYEQLRAGLSDDDPNRIEKLITYTREQSLAHYFNAVDISSTPYDKFDTQAPETVSGQRCYVVIRNGQPVTICSNTQVPNPEFFESRQQAKAAALQNEIRKILTAYAELISTLEAQPATSADVLATAYLELGDMNFLLRDMSRARENYRKAHNLLADAGLSTTVGASLMGQPRNIIRDLTIRAANQIQLQRDVPTGLVSFDVEEDGSVANLGIVGQGEDLEESNQELIAQRLRNSVYRPRLDAGVPIASRIERLPASEL